MRRWGAQMLSRRRQIDNHDAGRAAKVALRRTVLEAIGPTAAVVLDCFAGRGAMYRAVWCDAARYVGCDTKWTQDERLAYVCDNRRLLRHIDLSPFNVFDLDAYGSPWEQVTIIAARRPLRAGERIGFVMTDGSVMRARLGRVEGALAGMAGVRPDTSGVQRDWETVTAQAVAGLAERMGAAVESLWHADTQKRPILYSACVLRAA